MSNAKMNFHPGSYIKDTIEELGISQHEFATRVGVTEKYLSTLINGEARISFEFASKLSKMLGTGLNVWLNLQTNYDLVQSELEELKEFEKEVEILKSIDSKFLLSRAIFEPKDPIETKIQKLRQALPIASLCNLRNQDIYAFHRITNLSSDDNSWIINSNVWLSLALNEAKKVSVPAFDEKKLIGSIPLIREMTLHSIDNTYEPLKSVLSSCGVNLVLLPYLKNSRINGFVRWISESDHVVIGLNGKGRYQDIFWFTLFHEIGHALQKVKRRMIVDGMDDELEQLANQFAKDTLIPSNEFHKFVHLFKKTSVEVLDFSETVGIHPGIVVGRLQNDGILNHRSLNSLRQKIPT